MHCLVRSFPKKPGGPFHPRTSRWHPIRSILFRPIIRDWCPPWRSSTVPKIETNRIFHHFPIPGNLVLVKCRQFSVLGFTRGSLGSFYTAIVRRPLIPLVCWLYTTKRLPVQRGRFFNNFHMFQFHLGERLLHPVEWNFPSISCRHHSRVVTHLLAEYGRIHPGQFPPAIAAVTKRMHPSLRKPKRVP